jgi:hypothetical protein
MHCKPAASVEELVPVDNEHFVYMIVELNDYRIEGRNAFFIWVHADTFIAKKRRGEFEPMIDQSSCFLCAF